MRPNCHFHRATVQFAEPLLRNSQLRRRAAPEQITRSRRNNQEVRSELRDTVLHSREIQPVRLRINQERFVPRRLDLVKREQQLQWIVRLLASEVDGSTKVPCGINQREFHDAISLTVSVGSFPAGTPNGVATNRA